MLCEDADCLLASARDEDFHQFVTDAFPRQDCKTGPFSARGGKPLGVGFGLPVSAWNLKKRRMRR